MFDMTVNTPLIHWKNWLPENSRKYVKVFSLIYPYQPKLRYLICYSWKSSLVLFYVLFECRQFFVQCAVIHVHIFYIFFWETRLSFYLSYHFFFCVICLFCSMFWIRCHLRRFKSIWLTHFRPMFHLCRNQVVGFDLHLYLKCHSSTSVFQTFW